MKLRIDRGRAVAEHYDVVSPVKSFCKDKRVPLESLQNFVQSGIGKAVNSVTFYNYEVLGAEGKFFHESDLELLFFRVDFRNLRWSFFTDRKSVV